MSARLFGNRALLDSYHLCRFWTRNIELEVCILLPVPEQKGELQEESVVCVPKGCQCLRTGVPIQAPFQALTRTHQLFPVLEAVGVGVNVSTEALDLSILLVRSSIVTEVAHGHGLGVKVSRVGQFDAAAQLLYDVI
jgi:hypothetical protein